MNFNFQNLTLKVSSVKTKTRSKICSEICAMNQLELKTPVLTNANISSAYDCFIFRPDLEKRMTEQ